MHRLQQVGFELDQDNATVTFIIIAYISSYKTGQSL